MDAEIIQATTMLPCLRSPNEPRINGSKSSFSFNMKQQLYTMTSAFAMTVNYHRLIMRAFTFLGFLLDIIKQNLCLYEEGIIKCQLISRYAL